jgi:hypothetical protein
MTATSSVIRIAVSAVLSLGEEEADTRVPGGFHIQWPP